MDTKKHTIHLSNGTTLQISDNGKAPVVEVIFKDSDESSVIEIEPNWTNEEMSFARSALELHKNKVNPLIETIKDLRTKFRGMLLRRAGNIAREAMKRNRLQVP